MTILNRSKNPLVLRHDGVVVQLPPGLLIYLTAEQEKAVKGALKTNRVIKALADSGKVVFGGSAPESGAPLSDLTAPEAPAALKNDPEKSGKKAALKEMKQDGTMAV